MYGTQGAKQRILVGGFFFLCRQERSESEVEACRRKKAVEKRECRQATRRRTYRCLQNRGQVVDELARCDFDQKVMSSVLDTHIRQLVVRNKNNNNNKKRRVNNESDEFKRHLLLFLCKMPTNSFIPRKIKRAKEKYPESKHLDVWILVANAALEGFCGILGRDLLGPNLVADLEV
jgi:hypothetical protein